MKNFKSFIALLICTVLFNNLSYSQKKQNVDFSQALRLGDNFVPPKDVEIMRGKDKSIDWKSLENKVVLLDFFSTSCGTCIQIMPHLQELEQKHPDKFKVIIVTAQDKETLEQFFAKNKYLKEHQVNLPVIYNDSYFHELFPHNSEPHEVLLFRGKVQAITSSGSINEASILKLFKENVIDLPLKDDYGFGNLFEKLNQTESGLKAGVIFSGYQNGIPFQSWKFEQDSLSGLFKSSHYNNSIYGALLSLTSHANTRDNNYIPRMDRVVWKVRDSTKYYDFKDEKDTWMVKNAISYERFDRQVRADSIQARIILEDFLNFYGLKAYEGNKMMECLILSPCPVEPYVGKELIETVTYRSTTAFSVFTDFALKFPPVVDLVKNDSLLIKIGKYETLQELNKQLMAYGIKAEIGKAEKKVLVIEEVN